MKFEQSFRSQFCALRTVYACSAILLEDKPGRQPAIALQKTNIINYYSSKHYCNVIGSNVVTGL